MSTPRSAIPHAAIDQPVSMRQSVFVVSAGFLGWMLDAFDYFLVVVALPQIAKDFHVGFPTITWSIFLTLAFRPVGAFIFGLLADRFGRRVPMMVNLVFYSAIEVATAFAPNLWTFMVLRALFGIGMGGEWGVGASLVMEKVPRKWRGALGGFLQEGYSAGYLLAAVASYFLLDHFGWRKMFLLGGIPALLTLFIRFGVKESEVWQKYKAPNWTHLVKSILSHWKLWLYLTALMAMMNFASHGTQDLFPTFLNKYHKMSTHESSRVLVIMNIGSILGGIAFGMASDRVGRRLMMILAFIGALVILHLWAFSESMQNIILGAFFLQFMIQGAWGIIPAHINELSPNQVRGFLPGFAYQCGNLVAASIARLQSTLVVDHPFPNVLFMTAGCIFIVAIIVISAGVERRGVAFTDA